jgi:uncharacterized protein
MGWSKSTLSFVGAAVGAGAGAALTYRLLTERWNLTVTRATFGIRNLPPDLEGLTMAHLSDLHVGELTPVEFVAEAVHRTNRLRPDVVVLTGDYVEDEASDLEGCAEALGELSAPLGVFAVLGNHDYAYGPDLVAGALASHGIRMLRNERVALGGGPARLWIVGLDDTASHREEFGGTLAAIPEGEPIVVLSHSPDVLPRGAEECVEVVLAGHTHGGQVRLPLIGAPHSPTRVTPRYSEGYSREGHARLHVNRGIGMTLYPVRLNCPPEIGWFTFQSIVR